MMKAETSRNIGFDQLPAAVENLTEKVDGIAAILDAISRKSIREEAPITRKELCERLGISVQTAISWGKSGRLPELRIGGAVRYDWEDVKKALENKSINQ